MELIDQKLQKVLSDPNKQKQVEIKIIGRLFKHDTNNAFHSDFHSVLENCKKTRTPNKEDGQIHEITTSHHIYTLSKDKFCDTHLVVQKALAHDFLPLVIALRKNLYNKNNQTEVLRMIQELFEMSLEQDFYENYSVLFEYITQAFYKSRRLLMVALSPQIIDQYILTLGSTSHPTNLSFQSVEDKEHCRFSVDEHEFICEFSYKTEGKFFGSIVQIKAIDGSKARTYYLKANKGYPATNTKGSNDSIQDTTSFSSTLESISSKEKPAVKLRYIDLREPFMYKVLEHLGYGAKTYILVNPYILYGLFIITEDLNSEPNFFYSMEKLKEKIELETILNANIEFYAPVQNIITNQFTEVSILSSIFNLCDLHLNNWGYLATDDTYNQLKEGKKSSSRPQIRIIDFLIMDDSIQLEEMFLSGQIPGVKLQFSNISVKIANYLKTLSKLNPKEQEEFKTAFEIKIKQGQAANQKFHKHLRCRQIHDILERTKAKLLKQIAQYPLILPVIKPEEESLLSLNGNPCTELMKYCNDIESSYENWKTFITEGYQQWFNHKLETAKQ